MILSLIVSLCLTLIIELTLSFLLGIKNKEDIKVVIWANIFTNPMIVYLANCIKLLNNDLIYNILVLVMKIIVVIAEFIIYKKYLDYKEKSPLLISIINNTISFLLGIVINKYIF